MDDELRHIMRSMTNVAKEMRDTIEDPNFDTGVLGIPDIQNWVRLGKPKWPPRHAFDKEKCVACGELREMHDEGMGSQICPEGGTADA